MYVMCRAIVFFDADLADYTEKILFRRDRAGIKLFVTVHGVYDFNAE